MNTTPFSMAMTALLALAVVMALAIGAVPVSLDQLGLWTLRWWPGNAIELPRHVEIVLSDIRMPRLLMGMLIGASLAMAGASIQGLFRNPLADPGLIGVSSGAALAALAVIVLGNTLLAGWMTTFGFLALPLAAFGGALGVTWIIYWIAKRTPGGGQITTLILAGVAITAFAGAVSGILTFLANDAALRSFTFWSMGSLASVTWRDLAVASPWILISLVAFPLLAPALNVLLMGESVCEHLGIDPHRHPPSGVCVYRAGGGRRRVRRRHDRLCRFGGAAPGALVHRPRPPGADSPVRCCRGRPTGLGRHPGAHRRGAGGIADRHHHLPDRRALFPLFIAAPERENPDP